MRYELLSANLFDSIDQAQEATTQWQWTYITKDRAKYFMGVRP
jgi:hypothetical protein